MYGYWGDYTLLLLLPGLLLGLIARMAVSAQTKKYAKVASRRGWTGRQLAERALADHGLSVRVKQVSGRLTDHYDPRDESLGLSQTVYDASSITALGIAAHEVGHALQYRDGYFPVKIRAALVPVANFGSYAAYPILLLGLFLNRGWLLDIGIALYGIAALFYLVTLPVELNASRRGMELLESGEYLERDELPGARKVLTAAAWTYVAALVSAALQLLRLVLLFGRRRRD
ncbi:MAG: zinc metallopeptidase [Christensenellales bacterium]|jgi:Zn-dependent membrane protease YugP